MRSPVSVPDDVAAAKIGLSKAPERADVSAIGPPTVTTPIFLSSPSPLLKISGPSPEAEILAPLVTAIVAPTKSASICCFFPSIYSKWTHWLIYLSQKVFTIAYLYIDYVF